MWLCKKCQYKNGNSSKTCHGKNCDAVKEKDTIKSEIKIVQKKEVKRIYDHCPACGRDMFFTPTTWKGRKAWSCESGKHRPCNFSGKSKPFPVEEIQK